MNRPADRQEVIDTFFWKTGRCCAGCDWWHHFNSVAGECTRSAPVSGTDRFAMLGLTGISANVGAGQIMTRRDHVCGEFRDSFDWSSLPIDYLKRIGAPAVS